MLRTVFMALWSALAAATTGFALPPPDPGIDESEAKLMLECAIAMRPAQPIFPDPVALDSPNAVGRYVLLVPLLDERIRNGGGYATLSADKFEVTDPELFHITTAEYQALLEAAQPVLAHFIAASKLNTFAVHELVRPAVQPLSRDDPRRNINSSMRKGARLLRDDAVRCWASSKHDEAMSRVCAILRMGGQRATHDLNSIDALVADSLIQNGIAAANCFLGDSEHPLSPAARAELRDALATLDANDPSGLYRTWRREYHMSSAFVNEELEFGLIGQDLQMELASLHGGFQVVRAFTDAMLGKAKQGRPAPSVDEAVKGAVDKATEDAPGWTRLISRWQVLRDQADEANRLFSEIDALWKQPDGTERLRPIDAKVDSDQTGINVLILGVPRQTQKTWRRGVDSLADLYERLRTSK